MDDYPVLGDIFRDGNLEEGVSRFGGEWISPMIADHQPVLLLHRVAPALVVALRESVFFPAFSGVVEGFAKEHTAPGSSSGPERIAIAQAIAEICAPGGKRGVSEDAACVKSGAAGQKKEYWQ